MPASLDYEELRQHITENVVDPFYKRRLAKLGEIRLRTLLRKKNPYLFKAKNIETAEALVREIVDAYISSGEETSFGDYLEQLSIHICGKIYGGRKSGVTGIDLEFEKEGVRYLVVIKSGPNWGNSSQIAHMRSVFNTARRTLRTSGSGVQVECVNGCCYGKCRNPNRGDHWKYCGQAYWEFISGDPGLYLEIITPLGEEAEEREKVFKAEYEKKIDLLTKEMLANFCKKDGQIDWDKILRFGSEA